MVTPCLKNEDLPLIFNGFPGDPFHSRPFASTFTDANIRGCWEHVVYAPFTRATLKNKYICHKLGETNEWANDDLQGLVDEYEAVKQKLEEEGFNVQGIFDTQIPTATTKCQQDTED